MRVGLPVGACRPAARLPDRPVAYLPPAVFLPAALLNRAGVGLARAPVIQHVFHSPFRQNVFRRYISPAATGASVVANLHRRCGCDPTPPAWLQALSGVAWTSRRAAGVASALPLARVSFDRPQAFLGPTWAKESLGTVGLVRALVFTTWN